MSRAPVLVTRKLPGAAMALLEEHCLVTVNPEDRPMPRARLLAEAAGKHGILALLTDRVDAEVLDAAGPDLRVVANYAVGHDNVDLEACGDRGILVTTTPDVLTAATADLTWGLVLAAARRIAEGDRWIRSGRAWEWAPGFMVGREVAGRVLGVVGFGRIGQAVAARARGFDMPMVYHSRTPRPDAERALGARPLDLPRSWRRPTWSRSTSR